MNCSQWEERIALHAGGDLSAAESAEVERHLGDCPGCQLFASGLRESLDLLQEADREPISPAHFAAVRARVMSQLETERRPWWRRAWVYGLAAGAMAALFLMLVLHPQGKVRPQPVAVQAPPPPVESAQPLVPAPVVAKVRHARRRRILPAVVHTDPGPPIVVKLLTDDPDVVIYWITDKSGE